MPTGLPPATTATTQPTVPATVPPTQPTEPPTQPTEPQIIAPAALESMLAARGSHLDELKQLGCTQLITVSCEGNFAQIDLYILENYQWVLQEALSCSGRIGSNGATDQKREGDMATPRGLYPITQAFYIHEEPQTGLPVFQITDDTYWVDDPTSVYYNKRIEGTENKDWSSAERMIRYDTAYEYGFVVDYNVEAIPHAGSAIFFHIGSGTTAGCIATERDFVLQYLAILDGAQNPYILIQ